MTASLVFAEFRQLITVSENLYSSAITRSVDFQLRMHQKPFIGGNPLGRSQDTPDPLCGFREEMPGNAKDKKEGRKGEGKRGKERGKITGGRQCLIPAFLFPTSNL